MKKTAYILMITAILLVATFGIASADKPVGTDSNGNETAWEKTETGCKTIQSGMIKDSLGNTLTVGYDQFGYNYQAHMFNGTYDSSDRNLDGAYWGQTGDFVDDKLMMKWSDEWIANVDCDGDGKLDRGLVNDIPGGTSYGWLTNHVEGDYLGDDGEVHTYTEFVKIVWTGPGSPLWGQYTVIEDVYNDPYSGFTGVFYKENPSGLGFKFIP